MTQKQIAAVQGLSVAVLAALVGSGTIDAGQSNTVQGLVTALLAVVAAFLVQRPKDL